MNFVLFFHFVILIIAIILLIFGTTTSRWLVYVNESSTNIISEHSKGIILLCQRFYRHQSNADSSFILKTSNITSSTYMNRYAYTCFNRLHQWYNPVNYGPDLSSYNKASIVISFGCICVAMTSLFMTQFVNTVGSFAKMYLSKRLVDCLLMTNILTAMLALVTLTLFFGFEQLENILNYGYSFWSFLAGTFCIFLCCILIGIFRIDVEFEFQHYQHESVVSSC